MQKHLQLMRFRYVMTFMSGNTLSSLYTVHLRLRILSAAKFLSEFCHRAQPGGCAGHAGGVRPGGGAGHLPPAVRHLRGAPRRQQRLRGGLRPPRARHLVRQQPANTCQLLNDRAHEEAVHVEE